MISMPFTGKEEEEITRLDFGRLLMVRHEESLPLHEIEQLIFIQHTALGCVEKIAVGMVRRRIRLVGMHFVVTHRTDGKSPTCIALISYQVFALLHGRIEFRYLL